MDNDVKQILMQLVDTTNKLVEGQKQMSADISNLKEGQKRTDEHFKKYDEHFKKIDERLDKIENDLDEIKEDVNAAKITASHNGSILEKLTDQLTTLNIVDVKYYESSR